MRNKICLENGVVHELTQEELCMLQHVVKEAYEHTIFDEGEEIKDTGTVLRSEAYKDFSKEAKALVNLYSLLYEHLD